MMFFARKVEVLNNVSFSLFPTQADKLIDGRLASHAQLNQHFIFCIMLLWTLFTNELNVF